MTPDTLNIMGLIKMSHDLLSDTDLVQPITDILVGSCAIPRWRAIILDISIKKGGQLDYQGAIISEDYQSHNFCLLDTEDKLRRIILSVFWPVKKQYKSPFNKVNFLLDRRTEKLNYQIRFDEDYEWLQSVKPNDPVYINTPQPIIQQIKSWAGLSPDYPRPWISQE